MYGTQNPSILYSNLSIVDSNGYDGFFTSLVACLWAFDGWADLNFLAEEVVNPERVLPLVMLSGVATVTVSYLLVNLAYLAVLPAQQVASSTAIAIAFGRSTSLWPVTT